MAKTFKNLLVPKDIVWKGDSQEDVISSFLEDGCSCVTCNCSGIPCERCIFHRDHMLEATEFIKSIKYNIEEDDLLL